MKVKKNEKDAAADGKAPFSDESAEKVKTEAEEYPGRVGPIGPDEVAEALSTFRLYKEGKASIDNRAISNEEWYRQRYAETRDAQSGATGEPEETSAWLFNSIANKHADAMDNIPCANILPREESDARAAETLSKIVPLIMDKAEFEQKYDENWYNKLISGGSIYKIFWNNDLENGLGDIDIETVDVLNVAWEPGEEDVQNSTNFFHVEYENNSAIEEAYPFMKGKLISTGANELNEYHKDDNYTNDGKSLIYDWYYKKRSGTKTVVHYCRFCNGEVLWASENTPEYAESGYYDHGMYPFVFDSMFRLKGSPYGFGYVDVMKSPQYYIDKLDKAIIKNAAMATRPRWMKKESVGVNMEQFADWSNDFVDVTGNQIGEDSLRQILVNPLPAYVQNHYQAKIEELKETSGNRDFSQGSTASGVTAASAIAALQEAGSKLSRDMLKSTYRAYKMIVTHVVELIRQFYTEERYFRIESPNGGVQFVAFDNTGIREQNMGMSIEGEISVRRPVFDYKISSQKQSPFSRTAQNELAKELFKLGVFNPAAADQVLPMLDMMDFEGIDAVKKTVSRNGQLYQQLLQMTQLASQLAVQADNATGGLAGAMQQVMAIAGQGEGGSAPAASGNGDAKPTQLDQHGMPVTDNTTATKARLAAANRSTPR